MMDSDNDVYAFSMKEKNALVEIYKDEILRALIEVPLLTILNHFGDVFDNSEIKQIKAVSGDGESAGKQIIYKLASKAHDPRVFVRLLELISKLDPNLSDNLRCRRVFDSKHYQEILSAYGLFKLLGDAYFLASVVTACSGIDCVTAGNCDRILSILVGGSGETKKLSPFEATIQALSLFIREIPKHNAEWYWLFMGGVLNEAPNGTQLRDKINANYEADFKNYQLEKITGQPGEALTVLESTQSVEDWLRGQEESAEKAGDSIFKKCSNMQQDPSDEQEAGKVTLRQYQLDLASAALQGRNSVICAPTGSGKTYVAAEIIRRHFEGGDRAAAGSVLKKARKLPKKVVFLVPTVQLVDQQFDVLKSYLSHLNLKMKAMKGGAAATACSLLSSSSGGGQTLKAVTLRANDLLVATPQVLLNVFNDKSDEEASKVDITALSLLVFDECHHTTKEHPYNEIMTMYLDMKYGNPDKALDLPQIAGLTASLGVGKADTKLQAIDHVLKVSASMDAHSLATISEENLNELNTFVNVPVDRVVTVKQAPHPLTVLIEGIMGKIEKLVEADMARLKPKLAALFGPDGGSTTTLGQQFSFTPQPPARRNSPQYTSWVGTWLAQLPTVNDSEIKPRLTSAFEHLRVYEDALDLNAHVPPEQALAYVCKELTEFKRKSISDRDHQLVRLYEKELSAKVGANEPHYMTKNALVEKLCELLKIEFEDRPDARVIVFVHTRVLTSALKEFMNSDHRLRAYNAARLTGVQAAKDKGGQTVSEQQDLLERFRNGDHKILISTTVAEEGLDVEKCHLIIKYNHVTNEIAMVQRRGRGRAHGSECILLVKDNWIEEKEKTNVLREYLMDVAVKTIQEKGQPWFRGNVEKMQLEEFKKRAIERTLAENQRQMVAGKSYDMLCKKCERFIISTGSIRRVVNCHYVGVDPSIWDRLFLEPTNGIRVFEAMAQSGSISCKGCRCDFGIIIRYSNTYLPGLKIASFSLKLTTTTNGRNQNLPQQPRLVKKKWNQATPAYFNVDNLENSDLREMFQALDEQVTKVMDERIRIVESLGVKSSAGYTFDDGDDE